ncbi:MAG TPA: hypothetical protein VNR59_10130 [Gaiellaceae bacterium]|nr:hypothetical protein [Gaiellaceae bacterium]
MESTSQVELPEGLTGPFQVFVNGIEQRSGTDFDRVGATLVFHRELAPEGKLGFWRWLSLFLGVAGTYRKNDTVDVVFTDGGSRRVLSLEPRARPER